MGVWMRLNFGVGMGRRWRGDIAVWGWALVRGGTAGWAGGVAVAQSRSRRARSRQAVFADGDVCADGAGAAHRTRLILKDGSYQMVMSYQVKGKIVSYISAERDATEEIPTELVDWDATHKWERQHPAADESDAGQGLDVAPAPAIDPELLKEEADRAAWTPEVAPDLRLPELDSVLALDYFPRRAGAGAAGAVGGRAEPDDGAQHSEAGDQSALGVAPD